MGNFFNTAWGTYVKTLLTAAIMFFIAHKFTFDFSLRDLAVTVIFPLLPALLKVWQGTSGGFLNTAIGGLVKYFVTLVLMYISANGIYGWTFAELLTAVTPTFLPVLFNALNGSDKRYGKKLKYK